MHLDMEFLVAGLKISISKLTATVNRRFDNHIKGFKVDEVGTSLSIAKDAMEPVRISVTI